MITSRFFAIGIAAALTLTSFSATASAAEDGVLAKGIAFSDLNLKTPEGRATLQKRIQHTVREVCKPIIDNSGEGAGARSDYAHCRVQAIANANQQIAALSSYERLASH